MDLKKEKMKRFLEVNKIVLDVATIVDLVFVKNRVIISNGYKEIDYYYKCYVAVVAKGYGKRLNKNFKFKDHSIIFDDALFDDFADENGTLILSLKEFKKGENDKIQKFKEEFKNLYIKVVKMQEEIFKDNIETINL